MEKINFYLDFKVCSQFAGLCWALEKGLYTDKGLQVELIPWVDDGRSIYGKVLEDTGTSIGSSEDNLIIEACSLGYPVSVISTMFNSSPLVLMTKDETIKSFKDLEHKRVGMHCDGIKLLKAILSIEGIKKETIDISEVPFSIERLKQDEFDVVQGYDSSEVIVLENEGLHIHTLPLRTESLIPFSQVIFTSSDVINEKPDTLKDFIHATFTGWREAIENKEEAVKIVYSMSDKSDSIEMELSILQKVSKYVLEENNCDRNGMIDVDRWNNLVQKYYEHGIISKLSNGSLSDILGNQEDFS